MTTKRKPVYIIHPFKGKGDDCQDNIGKVKNICRGISTDLPEVLPVSPVLAFSFLDDTNGHERDKALSYCSELLQLVGEAGGEAWYFGDWKHSEGCLHEIDLANEHGITLKDGDMATAAEAFIGPFRSLARVILGTVEKVVGGNETNFG